ncbi:MAG: HAD-IIA family hydrolase [Kiloniellales bacterium]
MKPMAGKGMPFDPQSLFSADVVLADLDGCLAVDNRPLPGAVSLAQRLGPRLHIVSNNSTDTAERLSHVLAAGGLKIEPARIHLAGEILLRRLAVERPGAPVSLAAAGEMPALAERLGIPRRDEGAAIVALCRDTGFDYDRLRAIARLLTDGAELWVANPDLTHPGLDGRPVPETGSLLAAVQSVAPDAVPRIFGKPEAALFQAALEAAGARPANAVMLGDNPSTDVAGAEALGIPALLIGPDRNAVAPDLASLFSLALDTQGAIP